MLLSRLAPPNTIVVMATSIVVSDALKKLEQQLTLIFALFSCMVAPSGRMVCCLLLTGCFCYVALLSSDKFPLVAVSIVIHH